MPITDGMVLAGALAVRKRRMELNGTANDFDPAILPSAEQLDLTRCALTAALSDQWQDISTAPKDGSKVDLLYPYPRGRTNDCEWRQGDIYGDGGWYWSRPTWTADLSDHKLLPESEWQTGSYPNMQPTHWMRPPAPPPSSTAGERK